MRYATHMRSVIRRHRGKWGVGRGESGGEVLYCTVSAFDTSAGDTRVTCLLLNPWRRPPTQDDVSSFVRCSKYTRRKILQIVARPLIETIPARRGNNSVTIPCVVHAIPSYTRPGTETLVEPRIEEQDFADLIQHDHLLPTKSLLQHNPVQIF